MSVPRRGVFPTPFVDAVATNMSNQIRVAAATQCVEELCFIVKNLNNLRASHGLSITYELGQRVL